MIVIRTIEELEAERERQLKKWIEDGKEKDRFRLKFVKGDADFREFNLHGANFNKAIFVEVNLYLIGLEGADLRRAYFENSDLSFAHLKRADLREAYLKHIDLSVANLEGADLRGANLEWANLTQANLRFADLRGAHFRSFQLGASNLYDTIITPSQYDELARLFNSNFMHFFIVKGLYEDL